jgi:protocatechuate 3,4-dioxygenase beta subunit
VGSVEVEVWRVAAGGRAWETRIKEWGLRAALYEGTAEVSDPEAEYAVTASSESETSEGESPLVRGVRPDAGPTDIRLATRPPLRVEVVDESGRPMPGVHVEVRRFPPDRPVLREPSYWVSKHRDSPGWPDDGHTGPDGVYAFERRLPPGPWAVLAQGEGTAQVGRLPRVEDAEETVRVVLGRGLRLMGKVEDPEGRSQWARFLEAWPLDGQQESVLVETLPHSGRFEFTSLAPGRYVLVSRPSNSFHHEEENRYAVSEPVPAGARGVVLTLRPGHRSTLDLRGPEGERLADAEVRVVGRHVDREVVADRDGLFQAIALPPGEYAFQVRVEGRAPFSLPFTAGKSVEHRLRP